MSKLSARTFIVARSALFASSVAAAAAGCTGGLYARSSPYVDGPPVAEDDSGVVYVEAPPVVDIETYPAAMYGGVYVYYVDGRWYQRGPRGWGYYRQEPPELGRQRQEHLQRDRDPRWAEPATDHRPRDERAVPPQAPRPGVTEAQPPDRRAQPEQPRRENMPAPQQAQQPRRETAPAPPPQAQRRDQAPSLRPAKAPVKSAPVHSTERQAEHR